MTNETDNNLIYLSNVRLSFPHLVEPQTRTSETGKTSSAYNCELIMSKDHPGMAEFFKKYAELALKEWKDNTKTVMELIQQDRKSRCFGSGDEKINRKTFKPFDGYAGHIYLSVKRDTAPQIIQSDGKPIDPNNTMLYQQLTRKMYAGCYVNVAVRPWLQKPKATYGPGIRCDLIAIQFAKDGEPFGEGAVDVSPLFGATEQTPAFISVPAPFETSGLGLPTFMTIP